MIFKEIDLLPPSEAVLEMIRQGGAAKRLLDGGDFSDVMNSLDQFHLAALVACPTGEAAKATRDYHHERLHALREIIAEVVSRAAALDAHEGLEDPNEPQDDE